MVLDIGYDNVNSRECHRNTCVRTADFRIYVLPCRRNERVHDLHYPVLLLLREVAYLLCYIAAGATRFVLHIVTQ